MHGDSRETFLFFLSFRCQSDNVKCGNGPVHLLCTKEDEGMLR